MLALKQLFMCSWHVSSKSGSTAPSMDEYTPSSGSQERCCTCQTSSLVGFFGARASKAKSAISMMR